MLVVFVLPPKKPPQKVEARPTSALGNWTALVAVAGAFAMKDPLIVMGRRRFVVAGLWQNAVG